MPALGFAAGIGAARLFTFYPYTIAAATIIAFLSAVLLKILRPRHTAILAISILAGFGAYSGYGPGAPTYAATLIKDEPVAFLAKVVEPPGYRDGLTTLTVKPVIPESVSRLTYRKAGRIRIRLKGRGRIGYGDIVRCNVKLKAPRGYQNPGVFDYAEYAMLNGTIAEASAKPGDVLPVVNGEGGFLRGIYDFRASLMRAADKSLGPDAAAIYNAIILGDQSGVTDDMRETFQRSGTTHILSVSGSHVALLAAALYLLVGYLPLYLLPERLALRLSMRVNLRKLAAGTAIPCMVMYCLIAGSELPTVRSVLMISVYLGSVLIGRHRYVMNTLSLAALVILIPDPGAFFDISFRLSFLSVLFMALAAVRVRGLFGPSRSGWRGFVSNVSLGALMTLAAIAGTYPLVAEQFNSFSLVALPANLVILPVAGFAAVPVGLISALLYAFTGSHSLPLYHLNEYALDMFYGEVRLFGAIPGAGSHPPAPGPLFTSLYYAGAFAFLLAHGRRLKYAGAALSVCAVTASMLLAGIVRPDGMRVSFIDVRQGDSALVEFPDGITMLIDSGGMIKGADPGSSAVAPYLRNLGIRRIDYIVLSHPAVDHIGGAVYLAQVFEVGQVWESYPNIDSSVYRTLTRVLGERGVESHFIGGLGEIELGGSTVQFLNNGSAPSRPGEDMDNDRSLALRIKYGEVSFLFTGDIEASGQRRMVLSEPALPLKSTVLKVPHHGSIDSYFRPFLLAADPEIAVISSGDRDMFGHPASEFVHGLESVGAEVYGTNIHGMVAITTNGEKVHIQTSSGLKPSAAHGLAEERDNYRKLLERIRLM
jgi:competence protein ComEC